MHLGDTVILLHAADLFLISFVMFLNEKLNHVVEIIIFSIMLHVNMSFAICACSFG